MTLEPLRAELMAVTMTTDRFRKIMSLVMNLEAAAYARGARDAIIQAYEHPADESENRAGGTHPNAGDESVGVIYEVLDSKLPESFIRCGFVNGMQRGSFQGRSYEYLSADGVNPARWVLVEKESV